MCILSVKYTQQDQREKHKICLQSEINQSYCHLTPSLFRVDRCHLFTKWQTADVRSLLGTVVHFYKNQACRCWLGWTVICDCDFQGNLSVRDDDESFHVSGIKKQVRPAINKTPEMFIDERLVSHYVVMITRRSKYYHHL